MRKPIAHRSVLLATLLLAACNWLPLTPEGTTVRVVSKDAVTNCDRSGTTNVSVKDRFGPIKRGADIVAEELTTLARNDAPHMGGNTVVAETSIEEGRQTFGIYSCGR
jgi:hypothetical protein